VVECDGCSCPASVHGDSAKLGARRGSLKEGGSSPSGGGGPLLWTVALLPPSPLEGVPQHCPHVPALLVHQRPSAPNQHAGQYEPDREDPEQGNVCHSASEPYSIT